MNDLPSSWVGVCKGWEDSCFSFYDALFSLRNSGHILVSGGSGSGKSTLLTALISELIVARENIVVLDPFGELAASTIEMCSGRVPASNIKYFDCRGGRNPGFNPLAFGDPTTSALGALSAIGEIFELGVQSSQTIYNVLAALAFAKRPLTDFDLMLTDYEERQAILESVTSEPVLQYWDDFENQSKTQQLNLASAAQNKLLPILAKASFRQIISNAPLNIGNFLDRIGSVLLVNLALAETHNAGRVFGSFLISVVKQAILARVDIPESQRVPVTLVVDEFPAFAMDEFSSILSLGRKYRISLVAAHQTLGQLSNRMRSELFGNVSTKVFFRVSREDAKVLSTDISGDPKAFDLANLPPGEAVVWQRPTRESSVPPFIIEVNEPLFSDPGTLSEEGEAFLDEIRSHYHRPEPKVRREPIQTPQQLPQPTRRERIQLPQPTKRAESSPQPKLERPAQPRPQALQPVLPKPVIEQPSALEDWLK